jgi:hypothetical protein
MIIQRGIEPLSKNSIAILTTLGTAVFIAAFILFFYSPPQARIGPEQPIPFSHNVHSGIKQIQCQYCHPYVAYSNDYRPWKNACTAINILLPNTPG